MSGNDTRNNDRVPASMRIRLKYTDEATFVQKYGANISRGGIFIATRTPKPVGTALRFEFQLADGEPLIRGDGAVVWVKPYDAQQPGKAHGMGVRFTRLDAESRQVIDRALAWKEAVKKQAVPDSSDGEDDEANPSSDDTRRINLAAVLSKTMQEEERGAATRAHLSPAAEPFGRPTEAAPVSPVTIELEADEPSDEELLAESARTAAPAEDDPALAPTAIEIAATPLVDSIQVQSVDDDPTGRPNKGLASWVQPVDDVPTGRITPSTLAMGVRESAEHLLAPAPPAAAPRRMTPPPIPVAVDEDDDESGEIFVGGTTPVAAVAERFSASDASPATEAAAPEFGTAQAGFSRVAGFEEAQAAVFAWLATPSSRDAIEMGNSDEAALDALAAEAGIAPDRIADESKRANARVADVVEKLSGAPGELDWLREHESPEPLPTAVEASVLLGRMLADRF